MAKRRAGDFSGLAERYQRYRPDYPPELLNAAIAFLCDGGGTTPELALDVGAGTGISTRAWRRALGASWRVVGAEPGAEMCATAARATPVGCGIAYLRAKAEALPLAGAALGLIAAAQAAHWFDRPRFYGEAERTLCRGGVLAILLNNRDWSAAAFLDRYEALLERHAPGYHRTFRHIGFAQELAKLPWVSATATAAHRWSRRLAPDELLGLMRSSSIARSAAESLGEANFRAAAEALIAEAVEADGRISLPYVGEVHLARKLAS
jgi:SAM-dependent methyltransferase